MQVKIKDNVMCECGALMRLRQQKVEGGNVPIDYLACPNRECKQYTLAYALPAMNIYLLSAQGEPDRKKLVDDAYNAGQSVLSHVKSGGK